MTASSGNMFKIATQEIETVSYQKTIIVVLIDDPVDLIIEE